MICKKCGNEMRLDDVDIINKIYGLKDKYWVCDKCEIGCCETVTKVSTLKIIWEDEYE